MMRRIPPLRPGRWPVALLCGLAALGLGAGPDDDAKPTPEAVIRKAVDFFAKTKAFSVDDVRSIKAGPMPVKQTVNVVVELPNRMAFVAKGGAPGLDVISDGKTLTVAIAPLKKYTQGKAPASFAALGEDPILQQVVLGGLNGSLIAEMLSPDPYKNVMDGVTGSTYVGLEDLDGAKVHHLKFVQDKFDWEAWIAADGDPLVRKTVTDLTRSVPEQLKASKPQLTHIFKDWKFGDNVDAQAFAYKAPEGFKRAKSIREALGQPGGANEERSELLNKPAPAIALKTLEGGKFDLADHKDRAVVLVDFWATWCGPCVQELPLLVQVADAFKDRGLVFRAVDLRENAEKVNKFQADKNLKFPVAFDADGAVGKAYNVSAIPTCVLIDKAGVVRAVHIGFNPKIKDELTREVEALLAGKPLDAEDDGKPAP